MTRAGCRGETFQGGESGLATQATVCTTTSVGVSVDVNTYEPHLLAGTMAHMIGHNIGMRHDDGSTFCSSLDNLNKISIILVAWRFLGYSKNDEIFIA